MEDRSRKNRFSNSEVFLMIEKIKGEKKNIFGKFYSDLTNKQKQRSWLNVMNKVEHFIDTSTHLTTLEPYP